MSASVCRLDGRVDSQVSQTGAAGLRALHSSSLQAMQVSLLCTPVMPAGPASVTGRHWSFGLLPHRKLLVREEIVFLVTQVTTQADQGLRPGNPGLNKTGFLRCKIVVKREAYEACSEVGAETTPHPLWGRTLPHVAIWVAMTIASAAQGSAGQAVSDEPAAPVDKQIGSSNSCRIWTEMALLKEDLMSWTSCECERGVSCPVRGP